MREIILTDKQKRELEKLKAQKLPYVYGPPCAGCGQAYPVQVPMYATKWRTKEWGSTGQRLNTHVATQVWCKNCHGRGYIPKPQKLDHGYYATPQRQAVKLKAREIAKLLLRRMSLVEPFTSKKLAEFAGLVWEPKMVKILTILHKKKIVKFEEGKWRLRKR